MSPCRLTAVTDDADLVNHMSVIRSVRALREKQRAWRRAIWNAEWSLAWIHAATPWRE